VVDLGDGAGDRRGVPQPAADEAQAAQDPNICSGSFPAPIFKVLLRNRVISKGSKLKS